MTHPIEPPIPQPYAAREAEAAQSIADRYARIAKLVQSPIDRAAAEAAANAWRNRAARFREVTE